MRHLNISRNTLFAGIFIIAGMVFRLIHANNAHFAGDEANYYRIAHSVAQLKNLPAYGMSITGTEVMSPGGTFHLLMAIPQFLINDPFASCVLIVLLNAAGLFLLFRIFSIEFSPSSALVFLALTVFAPYNVFYSDMMWNPKLLLFFSSAAIYLLFMHFHKPSKWNTILLIAIMILLPQFHLSGIYFSGLCILTLIVYRPRIKLIHIGWGIILGLLFYAPYFIAETKNGFANTKMLLTKMPRENGGLDESLRAVAYLFIYPAAEITYFLAKGFWYPLKEWKFFEGNGMAVFRDFYSADTIFGKILIIITALSVLFVIVSFFYWIISIIIKKQKITPMHFMALVNYPLLFLSFLAGSKAFYPHYTIVLFPLTFVPVVAFARDILQGFRKSYMTRITRIGFVIFIAAVMSAEFYTVSRYYIKYESSMGIASVKEIVSYVLGDSKGIEFDFRFEVPETRFGNYPFEAMSQEYFGRRFPVNERSKILYKIVPAQKDFTDSRKLMSIMEIGNVWVMKYSK